MLYEIIAGTVAVLTAITVSVAVNFSPELKMELPGIDWLIRAIVGTTVCWFGECVKFFV